MQPSGDEFAWFPHKLTCMVQVLACAAGTDLHVSGTNAGTPSTQVPKRHVQVLAQHAAVEAARDGVRRLESRERDVREVLQVCGNLMDLMDDSPAPMFMCAYVR